MTYIDKDTCVLIFIGYVIGYVIPYSWCYPIFIMLSCVFIFIGYVCVPIKMGHTPTHDNTVQGVECVAVCDVVCCRVVCVAGWWRLIGCLNCRSFFAKEPLIIGLFCEKWPTKIRHPMTLRHPVPTQETWGAHSKVCEETYQRIWKPLKKT